MTDVPVRQLGFAAARRHAVARRNRLRASVAMRPLGFGPRAFGPRAFGARALGSRTLSSLLAMAFGFVIAGAIDLAATTPAAAQGFTYNPQPPRQHPPRVANDGQMLVQAVEVDYDYNNSRVSAVGNVQLYYNGTSVEADKVIYDQKTKRRHAEGNIRMTDAEG